MGKLKLRLEGSGGWKKKRYWRLLLLLLLLLWSCVLLQGEIWGKGCSGKKRECGLFLVLPKKRRRCLCFLFFCMKCPPPPPPPPCLMFEPRHGKGRQFSVWENDVCFRVGHTQREHASCQIIEKCINSSFPRTCFCVFKTTTKSCATFNCHCFAPTCKNNEKKKQYFSFGGEEQVKSNKG